jgi:hypothetical protein
MKSRLNLAIVTSLLILLTLGCAHMSDPCKDVLLERILSPDGTTTIALYHRECASKTYTDARLEKPPPFYKTEGEVVCYLVSWGDRHPIEARWIDQNNIFIKTPDKLEEIDRLGEEHESCGQISIEYDFQRRNQKQVIDDEGVLTDLSKMIGEFGPCINEYYKAANPQNFPSRDLNMLIANDEHRSAAETLLGFIDAANCPISVMTYQELKSVSDAYDLKPHYLERLSGQVQR